MNEIKLKPCPICGGEGMIYHQSSKYTDHDGDYVYCMNCGCRTQLFKCFNGTGKTHDDTEKEAINDWNKGWVYDMSRRTFEIGDEVASNNCPGLIGKIINFPRKGTDEGLALVRVTEGKTLLVSLAYWHKVKKGGTECTHQS